MTSTTHLNDAQIVDAVDGRPGAAVSAHLAHCATCDARVAELRGMLQTVATDHVPEPSPLFWEHFPVRVSRAIDAAPVSRGSLIRARWLWGSAAAVAAVLVLLLLPISRETGTPPPDGRASDTTPATGVIIANPEGLEAFEGLEDLEGDEAWTMVRAVAEETDYEDVRGIGLTPRAGSLERAAMELTGDERDELARLIEQEIKRTGVSTP